jgi:uncharacterized protein YndB with AHSA1/START domain
MNAQKALNVHRSILINAPAAAVWNVIVSPSRWQNWMLVEAELDEGTVVRKGSKLFYRNEHGETYLTGTVTTVKPPYRLVAELVDVSWHRKPEPGEVTFAFALMEHDGRTQVDFSLGDLSIDPDGQAWHDAFANSRELEAIRDIVESQGER